MRMLGIALLAIVASGLAGCQSKSSESAGTSAPAATSSSQGTLSLWKTCMLDGDMNACREVRKTF
jgi:hypothetical protein